LILGLSLNVLIKDKGLCGESSLNYQRLGSLWHQYYYVHIKDKDLCGEPSKSLSISIVASWLINRGLDCGNL